MALDFLTIPLTSIDVERLSSPAVISSYHMFGLAYQSTQLVLCYAWGLGALLGL